MSYILKAHRVKVCPVCLKVKGFEGWEKMDKEKIKEIGRFGVKFEKCPSCS
jgi:hypothetical protein